MAWPEKKVAAEIDGGYWTRGRHSRALGQIKDNEKINVAQGMGWRVFRFTPDDIGTGFFWHAMRQILAGQEFPDLPKKG